MLVGKPLYLRGGFLDNSLSFNENGGLIGHSPQGSYTLSAIQIDKVHLTKHKVELEGARYGLHFLGALPYEDPTKALDRVKITTKKKVVKITIDRELVVTPKKKKEKENGKAKAQLVKAATPSQGAAPQAASAGAEPSPTASPETKELSDADQAKAEMAAAPEAERPADPGSVTTTTSPAHAAKLLKDALDKIFAPGLDDRMMAAMPDFWKLYYQAVAAKSDYRPKDPAVLRQNTVDKKAVLVSKFEPPSNEWAQASGIAGPALYHAVIEADGKPGEIAVARPIGFGLDESAVDSIRKASFEPATKGGKPVAVMLDLYVSFRIYSNRTAVNGNPAAEGEDKKAGKQLPGPYSLKPLNQ
ncbi:MAG: energy transducer TonB [Terracidiphilus sp.]